MLPPPRGNQWSLNYSEFTHCRMNESLVEEKLSPHCLWNFRFKETRCWIYFSWWRKHNNQFCQKIFFRGLILLLPAVSFVVMVRNTIYAHLFKTSPKTNVEAFKICRSRVCIFCEHFWESSVRALSWFSLSAMTTFANHNIDSHY